MKLFLAALLVFACCAAAVAVEPAKDAFRPDDVRVELTIKGSEFKVGQPIAYEVRVTNLSKSALSYMRPAGQVMPGHAIYIFDNSGKALPQPHATVFASVIMSEIALEPGASVTYRGYVSHWAVMSTPGNYSLKATWRPSSWRRHASSVEATSAPVPIEIVKPTDAERDRFLDVARKQLRDASTIDEMADAIWALAYTLDVRAIPDLVRAGQDINVSLEVENALRRFENKADVENGLLKELETNGPTEPLAYALSQFKTPATKSLPLLKAWLEKGDTPQRAAALLGLSMIDQRYGDASVRALILSQLKDKESIVRHHAVLAVGNGGFGDTLDTVMELAKNEPDVWVREQAITAVGWHKDDRSIPLLKQLAKDKNAAVKRAAIEALKRIGSAAAKAALAECAPDRSRKSD